MPTSPVPNKSAGKFIVTKEAVDRAKGWIPFQEAIEYVIDGVRITKAEWGSDDIYLELKDHKYQGDSGRYLVIHKEDGTESPIILRDGDLLGIDWVVLED